jgi:hypothetical protein
VDAWTVVEEVAESTGEGWGKDEKKAMPRLRGKARSLSLSLSRLESDGMEYNTRIYLI